MCVEGAHRGQSLMIECRANENPINVHKLFSARIQIYCVIFILLFISFLLKKIMI